MDGRPQGAAVASAEEPAPVAALEPALWRRLAEAQDLASLARVWLALQGQIVEGATRGLVLIEGDEAGRFAPIAFWPEGSAQSPGLGAAAELAIRERRGAAHAEGGATHIAYPILIGRGAERRCGDDGESGARRGCARGASSVAMGRGVAAR